jgi:hypothetical protein
MAQRFLAPEVLFEGLIKQNGTVSHDDHVVTRGYLHGNVINGIHPDSANYASVVADNGVDKLKIDPLTITSVTVNTTENSLANFVSNVYTGSNFQEGDIVFLTATSPTEAYIHNGGTAGTADDWELVNSGLSDAQIRSKFSASSGIDYNSATGEFTADQAEIQAFFSAGTGLSYSNGQFALNATSDQITEGSNNLFYADSLVDAHLSGGTAITYTSGVIAFNGSTDDVSEGSNLYFTTARVDAHLSGGTAISYTNGVIAFNGTTDDVTEGSNKYYAASLVYADLGVKAAGANDVQLLTFDNVNGEYGVLLSDVFAEFSAGQGLKWDGGGQFELDAVTDDIQEGANATNLWFTQSRARNSIQADPAAGNLLTFNQSSGDIALMLSSIRKSFANQSLTANTGLTLTHSLGERLVDVIAMDSSGNAVELEIVYTSTSQVTVKSTINLTGIDIAVRL